MVRSDRGGEYYGKYSEKGQHKGPFALYLEECGIIAQYTTPCTPQQNGVSERRNRTLMNMVRCMFARSGLPKFLWGEALKTANYICNRTPTKAVENTPFEQWHGYKPSLNHFHVWGCKAEAKAYDVEQKEKLASHSTSAYFVGYSEKSKGYKFYNSKRSQRIFETNKAVFYDELFDQNEIVEDASCTSPNGQTFEEWFVYPDIVVENGDINMEDVVIANQIPVAVEPDEQNEAIVQVEENAVVDNQNINDVVMQEPVVVQEVVPVRRSNRERKSAISDDYHVYAIEIEFDLGEDNDPKSYKEAMQSVNKEKWKLAMEDELLSMSKNGV